MHWTGFAARRARSRAGLLAAAVAIVAVAAGSIAGILGAAGGRLDDGVAELLAAAPPTASALRVETRLTTDSDAAADELRQVEDSLTAAIGDAPLDLTRSVRATVVDATIDDRSVTLLLGSEPGLEQRAVLVAGEWPEGAADAVVRSAAAEQLGLVPGDVIAIGDSELRVSGTWQPKDASDPSWFSDEAVGSGSSGAAMGPVLVGEEAIVQLAAELDVDADVRWTILPRHAGIGTAGLAALSAAIPRLEAATARLHNDSPDAVTFDGDLADTVVRASRAGGAVTGVIAVPLLLIAVLGGIVLALIARSLAGGRSGEEVLLRGRGLSGARRTALAMLESTVVAVLGSALGVGVVVAVLPVDPSTAWLVAAGAAVAAILILTVAVVTRRPVDARSEDSGRGALVASVGPLVLATVAAVIAAAQFFAAGSPVTVRSDGSVRVDALALAAPALLLVAFGLAARVAATPVLALVERLAARGAGILPVLPARQLARRTRTVAAALLVVVLGAGVATYAAAFDGTATSTDASRSAFSVGGAVRVEFAPTGSDFTAPGVDTEARYAALDGVDSALAVSREIASLGRDAVSLLVVDTGRLRELDRSYTAIAVPAAASASDDRLPILMTAPLASRIGVVPGDVVSVVVRTIPDPIDAVVAGIVPDLPTTGLFGMLAEPTALAATAGRLGGSVPEVNEVWLATDDTERVSAGVRAITSRPVEVLTRDGASDAAVLGVGTSLAWVGAIACLVLALVGFAAVTGALHRERRSEGVPLRSLGFGSADQARSRGVELALTAASAILLGVGVGALAAWLTVPALSGDLAFAWGPWLAAIAALAAGLLVIGVLAANRVARDVAHGGSRMSRRIGAARLAWRSATTTPAVSVLVVLVVALVAFAGSAAPGLLQAAQTTMLRHALAGDVPSQRDFSDAVRGMPSVGAGGSSDAAAALPEKLRASWGKSFDQLAAISSFMEPRLAAVVGPPRATVRLDVSKAVPKRDDAPLTRVILTLDPRLDERIEIVDGAAPTAVIPGEPIDILLIERVAEQTGWTVGEVRNLNFPLVGDVPVKLSGIARALDETDPSWSHVPTSLRADVHDDGLSPPEYTGVAFADAGSLAAFAPLAGSAFVDAWFPLEVDRIGVAGTTELVTEMRRFGTAAVMYPVSTDGEQVYEVRAVFASVAASTLAEADERVAGVAAVIAVSASGPVAVAVVVLVLASRLLAVRRRTTVVLAAARGASRKRLATLLALEGLALGMAGGALGSIAGVLVGRGAGPLVVIAPLVAALIPAVALPVLGLVLAHRRGRVDEAGRLGGAGRRVAELAVVALALAAVILTLTAGPEGEGATPLLVLLPVLLSAAGCVIALRLTPVLLRVVGRGARTARGLVPLLGPARAERDPAVGVAPVLAIVVGTAIAVFSSGFLATVSSGTDVAARAAIGADIRVTSPYFTQDSLDAIAGLDGVAASAPVYTEVRTLVQFPRTDTKVTVFVIDAEELLAVQGDGGGAFPAEALADDRGDGGSGAVPVVVSNTVAELADGSGFEVGDAAVDVIATVVGPSPFGPAGIWIVVDRAHAEQLVSPVFSPSTVLVDVADGDSVADARAALTDLLGVGSATTIPQELAAGRHADPGSSTLAAGLFSAIGAVAVLLAIAIALTLVLSSAARGRLFALLGALGLPRRQELGLVAWELAPVIIVSVPVGALLGLALVPLVASALDLTVFTGGAAAPAIDFGGVTTAALVLLFLAVALAAVTAAYLFARRTAAARTLRTIDEEG